MKYLAVLVLYLLFSLAACFAGLLGLVAAIAGDTRYTSNICKALDKLLAAMMGWNGSATVSKECGRSQCRFCRVLCKVLNWVLERDHCSKAAGG